MSSTMKLLSQREHRGPVITLLRHVRYRTIPGVTHAWRNLFSYKDIRLSTMDYDEYWEGEHSIGFTSDARVAVFLKLVQPHSSVAEIGCGDGTLLATLRDRNGAVVKGYDISEKAIAKARQKGVDAEVRDASTVGLDKTFDFVIIADCLEHLPIPEQLLDSIRTRFRNGLLISIPNSCYWRYRFRVLFGSFMVQWVAHPGEHLRFWSIADMRWWLRQLGFTCVATYPTWGVPLLKHLWPAMFAQNVIYLIGPPPEAVIEHSALAGCE